MLLAELKNEVIAITRRPDLDAMTESFIRSALLFLHQTDYYYKDIFETGLAFGSAEYIQDFEYRTFIPRWRALRYLRKYDNENDVAQNFFDIVAPENVLDQYLLEKNEVCYVAGEVLHARSAATFQHCLLGCYLNPDVSADGFDTNLSWIALDHPWAIIYKAAASVMKATGKKDEFAAITGEFQDQLRVLQTSNIENAGR